MKERIYNYIATIQVRKAKWVNSFISPLIEIEVSLRNGRRSIEARKYSEQILLLTRHI